MTMSRQITTTNKVTLTDMQTSARQGGKLIFTDYRGQQAALLVHENRLKAARFFPRRQSKIGAVYICKVKNAVKNLDAYFVEIGGESREVCFLSKKDAAHPFLLNRAYDGRILEGDEFPVQVIRDPQKTKQASVTTLISLSNEYFALSVGETKTGYSNKFSGTEKKRLTQLIQGADWKVPPVKLPHISADCENDTDDKKQLPVGMVVRTQAARLEDEQDLHSQFRRLTDRWENLFQAAIHRTCFSCLEEPLPPWQAALEQLAYPDEYDEILTDDVCIFNQLQSADIRSAGKTLRLYDEKQSEQLSLSKLYGLDSKIEAALGRRVWLKSGGYLVIEPTEALTVIDVNSGKYEAKKGIEETFYRINREAAEEIALQLRLRNLSGIIVADFINMEAPGHRGELLNYLTKLVSADRQKTTVIDMTPLGLVEITRKKGYKTLAEQMESN